jgi:RNA polymerase sigma-70 factor (ECF subfamily)
VIDILALRAVKGGSEDALCAVIGKYSAYVCTVIRNIIGNSMTREDVEEVASDVFFALWENAGQLRSGNLKAYLAGIARNRAKNKLREYRDALPFEDGVVSAAEDAIEATLIAEDERRTVQSAIFSLGEPDRDIFVRHYYRSQTVAEICAGTGLTEAAVKHRLVRGREKLKLIIEREANG